MKRKKRTASISLILMIAFAGPAERLKIPYTTIPIYWIFIVVCVFLLFYNRRINARIKLDLFSSTLLIWPIYGLIITVLYGFQSGTTPMLSLITNIIFLFIIYKQEDKLMESVFWGLILSCSLTAIISIMEITIPGYHYVELTQGSYVRTFYGKALGFQVNGNDNTALIFMSIITLLYCDLRKKHHWFIRVITYVLIAFLVYIEVSNGSRATLLAAFIVGLYLLLYLMTYCSKYWEITSVFVLIIGVTIAWLFDGFSLISEYSNTLEDAVRLNLMKDIFELTVQHWFLGVGAGNTTVMIRQSPHNLLFELISDYGIVVFVPVMMIFYRIFRYPIKNKVNKHAVIISVFMLCFLILSVSSSSMLRIRLCWIELAFFYKESMIITGNKTAMLSEQTVVRKEI